MVTGVTVKSGIFRVVPSTVPRIYFFSDLKRLVHLVDWNTILDTKYPATIETKHGQFHCSRISFTSICLFLFNNQPRRIKEF